MRVIFAPFRDDASMRHYDAAVIFDEQQMPPMIMPCRRHFRRCAPITRRHARMMIFARFSHYAMLMIFA